MNKILSDKDGCRLCPKNCGIDRKKQIGACGANDDIKIAKYYLHKFEEPIISGDKGSGTVFFTGCALKCAFCQNYSLSRCRCGKEITVKELSNIFKILEDEGAANINLVSPTQYSDKIIRALDIYKPKIPVVYNTHGYEKTEVLKEINDYVDIYIPDVKYFSPLLSERYSGVSDYFEYASKAVEFMINKPLVLGNDGLMKQGVIVRHLVLPMCVSDSKKILDWFSGIKDNAYLNIMSQYTPFGDAYKYPELTRKITKREYDNVVDYAISLGITKAFYQDFKSQSEAYIPEWDF